MDNSILLNKNSLVAYLKKPQSQFKLADLVKAVEELDIKMVKFMYPAGDGRLKTLNFVVNNLEYLENILTLGERVDGSSLFNYIDPSNSDLYVVPRFSTAFIDPFEEITTLTLLCSFFDKDGNPLELSPEYTLRKACAAFEATTGLQFEAMGELEFYVIADDEGVYPAVDQHGYHESEPFAKFNRFRTKCMLDMASAGCLVKYGHSEVGNFTNSGRIYEQNEIEFLPTEAIHAADELLIAKWILRCRAALEGLTVTFAPKIINGKAGSGLHVHMRLMDKGRNGMLDDDNKLSESARKAIAGMMTVAREITAFGNTIPTSYFRLVPNQEAPTSVCWGDRNRSVLVRVPLGWNTATNMSAEANCDNSIKSSSARGKQTVEIRSADCSADIYLLLASLAVACRHGWEIENALKVAERTYVDIDIHKAEDKSKVKNLAVLPASCKESARALQNNRAIFEKEGVFSPRLIDGTITNLKKEQEDADKIKRENPEDYMEILVNKYFYCG